VKILKQKWPDCRTFKGVEAYIAEALAPVRDRSRREDDRDRQDQDLEAERHRQQAARRRQSELESVWQQLSPEEQRELRTAAHSGHPADVLNRRPKLAHSLCLAELQRRIESDGNARSGATP